MSCQLRQLYNEDVFITTLLKQKNVTCEEKNHVVDSTFVGHIRTLKDVRELNLTINTVHISQKQGASSRDGTCTDKVTHFRIYLPHFRIGNSAHGLVLGACNIL